MTEDEGFLWLNIISKPGAEVVVVDFCQLAFCVKFYQDLHFLEVKVLLLLSSNEFSQLLSSDISRVILIQTQECLSHRIKIV